MSTELIAVNITDTYKIVMAPEDREQALLIYNMVKAAGGTEDEFRSFYYLCKLHNLDPISKEIWFMKHGGRAPTIFASRDGYLKIANQSPAFDGLESDTVYEGDKITKRTDGSILIEYGDDHKNFTKGKLRGAFANIFRNDRSMATSCFVALEDYDKKNQVWNMYKNAMIIKCAEGMALKRAFAISGLTTKEEVEE